MGLVWGMLGKFNFLWTAKGFLFEFSGLGLCLLIMRKLENRKQSQIIIFWLNCDKANIKAVWRLRNTGLCKNPFA